MRNLVVSAILLALKIKSKIDQMATAAFLAAVPILLVAATAILLIMLGIGFAIQSFPVAGLIVAAIVAAILWAVFLAMIPHDTQAADPSDKLGFLAQFDTEHGSGIFLAGLFDVWATPIAAVIPIWNAGPGPEDLQVLAAVLFSLFAIGVSGVAIAVDRTGSACPVGILSLTLAGINIALTVAALLKIPKNRGLGVVAAYLILTGSLFALAILTFFGDSGYVLRNCG